MKFAVFEFLSVLYSKSKVVSQWNLNIKDTLAWDRSKLSCIWRIVISEDLRAIAVPHLDMERGK
jgi:hypothetical protein